MLKSLSDNFSKLGLTRKSSNDATSESAEVIVVKL